MEEQTTTTQPVITAWEAYRKEKWEECKIEASHADFLAGWSGSTRAKHGEYLTQEVKDYIKELEEQNKKAYEKNKGLERIICNALEQLHHDNDGEFANFPTLFNAFMADHKRLMQAHADLIWMELTFDKMHKVLCPGHKGTAVEEIEAVFERVLLLERQAKKGKS